MLLNKIISHTSIQCRYELDIYLRGCQYNIMEDQIITEQIDVIVVGDRRYDLISLMLDQELALEQPKRKRTYQQYLQLLVKLVSGSKVIRQPIRSVPSFTTNNGIAKFTKIILTDSFWLHIHFFVHDNKIFDPFLFDACRGSISICIIAASESLDLNQTKTYLHQTIPQLKPLNLDLQREHPSIVKQETVIEGKIFSVMHEVVVSGFSSVLALKITDQKRIIEESSNLRLTVNQISRWIVDRHFQNKHKIKIKEQLGDQIQFFQQKSQKSFCNIM